MAAVLYRAESVFILPLGVLMFLLGARLLRAGAFEDGERGARLRARLLAVGFGMACRSTPSAVSVARTGSWWAGICALLTVLASWWLRRFDRGPRDLLMHRAYRAPQRVSAIDK